MALPALFSGFVGLAARAAMPQGVRFLGGYLSRGLARRAFLRKVLFDGPEGSPLRLRFTITTNNAQVQRDISEWADLQIPIALAAALNDTARMLRDDLSRELNSVFSRPTPWIQRSPFMERATRGHLVATVGIRDQGSRVTPAHYLKEHFSGGARGNKPMEKALQRAGLLPSGWFVVPGAGVKTDAYGNVSKATVSRIIRELQGGGRRQQAGSSFRLFVVRPGETRSSSRHLEPGIWSVAKVGDQTIIRPALLFVSRATYRKVLDLPRLAGRVVARDFWRNFSSNNGRTMRRFR